MSSDAAAAQEQFVLDLLESWSNPDADAAALAKSFTEDGCYRNIPAPTARGHEEIEALIAQLFASASFRLEVINVVTKDDIVYTERIDRLTFEDTTKGTLSIPVFGVYEMEDGLIKR